MKIIDKKKFDEMEVVVPEIQKYDVIEPITEKEINDLMQKMNDPVECHKEIAVKIKHYLDSKIDQDIIQKGVITESTRRWVEVYNNTLERIHKETYGDRSVSLHLHQISHADISAKMREVCE